MVLLTMMTTWTLFEPVTHCFLIRFSLALLTLNQRIAGSIPARLTIWKQGAAGSHCR
jgi:hypothetical protein